MNADRGDEYGHNEQRHGQARGPHLGNQLGKLERRYETWNVQL